MGEETGRAFGFEGSWRGYAPIAFTNLLLTIVTLGVYRFWATTRTRRYLWSHTRFIDETLEWGGTGMELFVGFLLVLLLFGLPLLFLQFGAQALVFQGQAGLAGLLSIAALALIFYLGGVARFRALRYRLSRTWWHGIRGGSDVKGWAYGWSYCWRYGVGMVPLYLLVPWAMMSLWNDRWSAMSFGSQQFRARGLSGPTYKRFLLFYLLPILFVLLFIAAASMSGQWLGNIRVVSNLPPALQVVAFLVIFIGVYALIGIISLAYYAAFLREAIGKMTLGDIGFSFEADLDDWVSLILGDIALVVLTLGIGAIFLNYRHWKFFVTHLDATGEISLSALTRSTTAAPGQGEGLADAFDIGAI